MSEWFGKRKALFIFMGILFIIIALFLMPAFARTPYENVLEGGKYFGKGFIVIFPQIVPQVFENLKFVFSNGISNYINVMKTYTILYFLSRKIASI